MHDIQTEWLGASSNPKKRKRYVLLDKPDMQAMTTLSADWRQLLTECVRNGENARWQTWLKIADIPRKTLLEKLLAWLLKQGWVCVFEEKHSGDWWPYRLELQHVDALRKALNLADPNALTQQWQTLRSELQQQLALGHHETLQIVLNSLDIMPVARAIERALLVQRLFSWLSDERAGTYRDFSLYARGATKEISTTEWAWLDTHVDLSAHGIERHTPLLLLSAHLSLQSDLGGIDLRTMPDFVALTPATVKSFHAANSYVATWTLVENRTSFERLARMRQADEGVIWLPGYPPSWWKEAVSHLLSLAPAPAKIACDPDPAGVRIALQVIQLWQNQQLPASPWRMGVSELQSCIHLKALTAHDQTQIQSLLNTLTDIPPILAELVQYMHESQLKGEQESYL